MCWQLFSTLSVDYKYSQRFIILYIKKTNHLSLRLTYLSGTLLMWHAIVRRGATCATCSDASYRHVTLRTRYVRSARRLSRSVELRLWWSPGSRPAPADTRIGHPTSRTSRATMPVKLRSRTSNTRTYSKVSCALLPITVQHNFFFIQLSPNLQNSLQQLHVDTK